MSKITLYKCDRCEKELKIDERLHFEITAREKFKMIPIKRFDLCKECAGETLGTMIGFDNIKEIDNFVPESKR